MHTIGTLERVFIWLGGYTPKNLNTDSAQDREPVSKLGATVLFAMVVAGLNWAVGGWTYAESLGGTQRYSVAALTAVMGMFLVLVFDRGLIYVIDTAGKVARWNLVFFTLFRVVVVLAVSSLTSQAVIPLLLGNELQMTALHMQETAEKQRVNNLGQQYQVGAHESAADKASREVDRLALAAQTLPPDIANHLASARKCWQDYGARRATLIASGLEPLDARERLRDKATDCSRTEQVAKAEQTAYLSRTRSQLLQATENQSATLGELQHARSSVTTRVEAARKVETDNLTPRSSAVLYQLLTTNPGAMGKWLLVTAVLLVCELLPLLYKLQMGQTPPGRRIAFENLIQRRKLESNLVHQEHQFALQEEITLASQAGAHAAMQQPEVRQVFADCFASTLKALAPSEAVASMMHDLQARGPDVVAFQRRHPQYAQVIGQAWRNALAQTMDLLMAGVPKPAQRPNP